MSNILRKPVFRTTVGLAVALIVFFVVWFALSAFLGLLGMARDDGLIWQILMKDGLAPGFAAYAGFTVVERYFESISWRAIFTLFAAAIAILAIVNLDFNSKFYLSQNRTSDWYLAIFSTVLSGIAALIGAFIFCRERWLH